MLSLYLKILTQKKSLTFVQTKHHTFSHELAMRLEGTKIQNKTQNNIHEMEGTTEENLFNFKREMYRTQCSHTNTLRLTQQ